MCAKDTSAPEDVPSEPEDGGDESTEEIRPRITGEPAARVGAYAELHGLSQREATEQLILIATGAQDVGERVEAMDAKLERVLEELQAPGVGAPVEDNGVVADGAVRAKIDYNNLSWNHQEPISRDEAQFSNSAVLKHTPRTRVPVVRGILLDEERERLSERELRELIMDVFGCARATADGYLQTGQHRSWHPHPELEISRQTDLFEKLQEQLLRVVDPGSKDKVRSCSSLEELFTEHDTVTNSDGEILRVWEPKPQYFVSERLFNARTRQTLWKLEAFLKERTRSGKAKLLFTRVLAYAQERGDLTEEQAAEIRTELQEEGVELPSDSWWE